MHRWRIQNGINIYKRRDWKLFFKSAAILGEVWVSVQRYTAGNRSFAGKWTTADESMESGIGKTAGNT